VIFGSATGPIITSGLGSPEGVVNATTSSLYLQTDGAAGFTLWTKVGSGPTGWGVPSSGGGGTPILFASDVTLTHAQILALFTTPVALVPAQGATTCTIPISISMSSDFSAGVYSNPSVQVRYTGDSTNLFAVSSGTLNLATKRTQRLTGPDIGISTTACLNKAIEMSTSAAPTGGNVANQYKVRVIYYLMTVL
jgi:hypothetical protein